MFDIKKGSWLILATAVSAALGASACQTDAYCFVCDKTGGTGGGVSLGGSGGALVFTDSGVGGSGGATDGGTDGATCSNTQTDIQNCGQCGHVCSIPGAFSDCVNGQCTFVKCADGLVDLNKDIAKDGCECTLTNTKVGDGGAIVGVEACDGVDNDCDGVIDNGFDLTTDVNNCGACNVPCPVLPNSQVTCQPVTSPAPGQPVGQCTYTCNSGFSALTGNKSEVGCPYQCPVFPTTAEVCNGIDDDCDGGIDNGDPGAGVACSDNCPINPSTGQHECRGVCTTGVTACTGTTAGTVCVGGGGSVPEICDALDNDCNGTVDDGFDLQTDPLNCGKCGTQCQVGDLCIGGLCQFTCPTGYKDIDGLPGNGCEYACPPQDPANPNPGTEICNGSDDDCDGIIDNNLTGMGGPCGSVSTCPAPDPCVAAGTCSPYAISPKNGSCYGVCSSGGTLACVAGKLICQYAGQLANELCNGKDDNCDGRIDEEFNLQQDPLNCGTCGKVCTATNAATITCSGGTCTSIVTCSPGYADLNSNIGDGCEYKCPVYPPQGESCNGIDDDCNGVPDDNLTGFGVACTSGCPSPASCVATNSCGVPISAQVNGCYGVCATDGVTACFSDPTVPIGVTVCNHPARRIVPPTELCDGLDNNCDGRIDEGFNKLTDVNNCGACGNVCSVPNATGVQCVNGGCQATACQAGYLLKNGDCSYKCPVFPTTAEVCNGLDDNCDGTVDNAPTDVGGACSSNCPGGVCKGICTTGTFVCQSGQKVCQGGGGVQLEVCNNQDDDCDGVVDNGFNLQTDPLNCGSCGNKCSLANTDVNGCSAGVCTVVSCSPGFGNIDNLASTGCEYVCPVYPPQTETCNGKDDNCDGKVDGADPTMSTPANFCKVLGACAGSSPQCQGSLGWRCNYSANVDVVASTGDVQATEVRCDGLDNNCNGQVDETFTQLGQDCSVGTGVCAGTSKYVCSSDKTTVTCPTTATPGAAVDELCNGKDDNCDGFIDERTPVAGTMCGGVPCKGWIDPMVQISGSVWIYSYEASRPDSTGSSTGSTTTRACSDTGRLPWTSVSQADAAAACAAIKNSSGQPMRLCTTTEWQAACDAGLSTSPLWSYASSPGTYVSGRCNDINASLGAPWTTGTGANCYANWSAAGKAYDMSGNVAEWTSTTATVNATTYYRVRGGSYQTFPNGTTCDFNFVLEQPTYQNFDLGFRCCSDAAP